MCFLSWTNSRLSPDCLAVVAKGTFGTGSKALHAAGLISEPREQNVPSKWTQEKVIAALKRRREQGLPFRGLSKRDPRLYSTVSRCFGGLQEALEAAGLKNCDSETDTS